ncbi:MAG: flagellin [Syntrophobacteraceae bacterium]|nr:flagellin [Syntrophobacteraceae bacterium]
MRITLGMSTDETLLNLNDQQDQINTLSQQISSGKQLNAASDNPYSWSQAMNTTQTLREYNSFLSNVNFATGWGNATESALSQFSTLLTQAKSVAESATSAVGQSQSATFASEAGGILQQAMVLANAQYNGQYIFSGTATDTQPFSMDSTTGDVTYNGNSSAIGVKTSVSGVSGGGTTAVNLAGDAVFGGSTTTAGGSNMLKDIYDLQQALSSGDSAQIGNSFTTLGNDFNQVNNQLTTIGTTMSGLTNQQTALNTMLTNEKGVLSNYQDTDVAAATVKLSTAQTAFQAALQVTTLLDKLNLASIIS